METPVQTDLDLLDSELAMAERHVARRHVLQQRDIVVKLALAKQDCAAARRLLSLFEEMHALCLIRGSRQPSGASSRSMGLLPQSSAMSPAILDGELHRDETRLEAGRRLLETRR